MANPASVKGFFEISRQKSVSLDFRNYPSNAIPSLLILLLLRLNSRIPSFSCKHQEIASQPDTFNQLQSKFNLSILEFFQIAGMMSLKPTSVIWFLLKSNSCNLRSSVCKNSATFSQTLSDNSVLLTFIFLRVLLVFSFYQKAVQGIGLMRLLLMFSVSILVFTPKAIPKF